MGCLPDVGVLGVGVFSAPVLLARGLSRRAAHWFILHHQRHLQKLSVKRRTRKSRAERDRTCSELLVPSTFDTDNARVRPVSEPAISSSSSSFPSSSSSTSSTRTVEVERDSHGEPLLSWPPQGQSNSSGGTFREALPWEPPDGHCRDVGNLDGNILFPQHAFTAKGNSSQCPRSHIPSSPRNDGTPACRLPNCGQMYSCNQLYDLKGEPSAASKTGHEDTLKCPLPNCASFYSCNQLYGLTDAQNTGNGVFMETSFTSGKRHGCEESGDAKRHCKQRHSLTQGDAVILHNCKDGSNNRPGVSSMQLPSAGSSVGPSRLKAPPPPPSGGLSSISQNRLQHPDKVPLQPRKSHSPERFQTPGAHNRRQPQLPPSHIGQHPSQQSVGNAPLERAPPIPTTAAPTRPGGGPLGAEIVPIGDGENIELTPLYRSLMERPFFHLISRTKSKQLLEMAQDGMFLIRPSTRSSDPLTLCLRYNGRTYNINIRQRRDGLYALGSEKSNEVSFHKIEEIVSTYTMEPLKLQSGERVVLTKSPAKMDHIYVKMPYAIRKGY